MRTKGKVDHATTLDAQISAFNFIEGGEAAEYLAKRQEKIAATEQKGLQT